MGTNSKDWSDIIHLQAPVIKGYGIHPWFATTCTEEDFSTLFDLLPNSAILGEIGLDTIAKDSNGKVYSMEKQIKVFQKQLEFAIQCNKPTSIHCVKAFGQFFECMHGLKTCPRLMMHSFSGNLQTLDRLLKLKISDKFYFSFSHFVNARFDESRWKEVISAVPESRILIESDLHCSNEAEDRLLKVFYMVCEAKQWTHEYTATVLDANSIAFLRQS